MNPYLLLAFAVCCEVIATLSLRAFDGFSKTLPSVMVVIGYGAAFYLLSQVLKGLSVGTVYAIWAGAGTALVAIAGALIFGDRLGWTGAAGVALIVSGVVVLNISGAASH